jgi:hypothetical protein
MRFYAFDGSPEEFSKIAAAMETSLGPLQRLF